MQNPNFSRQKVLSISHSEHVQPSETTLNELYLRCPAQSCLNPCRVANRMKRVRGPASTKRICSLILVRLPSVQLSWTPSRVTTLYLAVNRRLYWRVLMQPGNPLASTLRSVPPNSLARPGTRTRTRYFVRTPSDASAVFQRTFSIEP